MSDRVTLPPPALCGRPGWSADELAAIRQAIARLARPGVDLDAGWGQSDEGDPWFAVTHAATGELVLHLARHNNAYTAVAPAIGRPLHARDLGALIAESARRLTRAHACTLAPPDVQAP